MKIVLMSIGTRGDMEPFLAIGDMLQKRNHEVTVVMPEQFKKLAIDSNLNFFSLGSDFLNLINSEEGKIAMGGGFGFFRKIKAYWKLIKQQKPIQKELLKRQKQVITEKQPDLVIYNGKAVYPIIWSIKTGKKGVLVSPVPYLNYVKGHTHIGFHSNWGIFNKLSYKIANFGLFQTIKSAVKQVEKDSPIKVKDIREKHFNTKTAYTVSPNLFERPSYWDQNLQVLGYHERDKKINWEPEQTLLDFTKENPTFLLVTFGSMVSKNVLEKTNNLLKTLESLNVPAIINTAGGGLIEPKQYNKNLFHFVSRIPYDWVFPKAYGVIHHGGSGTTHTAIKYGCASLILPHIIDQFAWNEIVHDKGVGPKGIKASKITEEKLKNLVSDLVQNKTYKEKAQELSKRLNSEGLEQELVSFLID